MNQAEYYSEGSLSVEYYDTVTAHGQVRDRDLDLYRTIAGRPPRRVLELGCGTGRVALNLALAGHEVVGVDLSEAMLARAEEKRCKLDEITARRASFHVGDMTSFDFDQQFDVVLIPFYSFNALPTRNCRQSAMAVVARHMHAASTAVIHAAPAFMLRKAAEMPTQKRGLRIAMNADNKEHLTIRPMRQWIDEEEQMFVSITEYVVSNRCGEVLRRSVERLTLALFDDPECYELAAEAGLRIDRLETGFTPGDIEHRLFMLSKH